MLIAHVELVHCIHLYCSLQVQGGLFLVWFWCAESNVSFLPGPWSCPPVLGFNVYVGPSLTLSYLHLAWWRHAPAISDLLLSVVEGLDRAIAAFSDRHRSHRLDPQR